MPGGLGHSIPESGPDSGQGVQVLKSGKPKDMIDVIREMKHASRICINRMFKKEVVNESELA